MSRSASLREGDLDAREERLYDLLDRARDGDMAARATLQELVGNYPDFHRSLYSRAMNQATVFVDDTLEEPLLAALADERFNCQAWAAMGCGAARLTRAVPGLIGLLDHPQWIAREQAAHALGEIGDAAAGPALATMLRDPIESNRQAAAEALSAIGGDDAFAVLWEAFQQRQYQRIGYLASALATFTPQVIDHLNLAAMSADPDQRYWAAIALGSTGDDLAVPTLERLLSDRGVTVFDGWVSTAAKKGLRTLQRIQKVVAARQQPS